jgi:hypothetical protein
VFPYLDLAYFTFRTVLAASDVTIAESRYPGFVAGSIAGWSSWLNSRLRKRYGNAANLGNALPLGQRAPTVLGAGTSPPPIALQGRPTLGSVRPQFQVDTPGPLGTATVFYSVDGSTPSLGPLVSSPVPVSLPGTGMQVVFPAGTYSADNVYTADTPVPPVALGWLVALVSFDVKTKIGRNPQDPAMLDLTADRDRALAEVKEAADSKDGLFDLPACEDTDSAVTTGGPLGYSETSPYVSIDRQARVGRWEDNRGRGSS